MRDCLGTSLDRCVLHRGDRATGSRFWGLTLGSSLVRDKIFGASFFPKTKACAMSQNHMQYRIIQLLLIYQYRYLSIWLP